MSGASITTPHTTLDANEIAAQSTVERLATLREYLKSSEKTIQQQFESGAGGLEIARLRGKMMDELMSAVFAALAISAKLDGPPSVALCAVGGYGRATLNPGSDIDLLFLLPMASNKLAGATKDFVESILYVMWDLGFKVGHSSRSIAECVAEADKDPLNRTAMLDVRFLAGNEALFDQLDAKFFSACLEGDLDDFLAERQQDINARRKKFSNTVFLQEPNIKESPGGLRDYHNLIWVLYARRRTRDLESLIKERLLTRKAYKELVDGFEFLHRVRNTLHYYNNTSSDLLTLRLQGIVADAFAYPQPNILRRIEAFMRDYYTHTKNIHQHTTSIFESFEIEIEDNYKQSWAARIFTGNKAPKRESFSAYYSRSQRIFPRNQNVFDEDRSRLMRVFAHAQKRNLRLSPSMRKLIKKYLPEVDESFRTDLEVRKAFRQICERKGDVARSLRQMHRVGFLGAFMPEFGALTCLVQHEFFHRYTADEHTLRCIDQLDDVHSSTDDDLQIYRNIYHKLPDAYPFIIAVLMHDAGRAENVREHIDGSAFLAAQVCDRLRIRGEQRRLITFLVDHHLTLFRYATKYDIDDPEVIAEFASQMKEPELLDAMLLFTYIDSRGTSEDNWTKWKESLIIRLYKSAKRMMETGEAGSREEFEANKSDLLTSTLAASKESHTEDIRRHFELMPDDYLRYRYPGDLAVHARAIHYYLKRREESPGKFEFGAQWLVKEKLGFTDLVIATEDRPHLCERIAYVLADAGLNILSADVYTRADGIVLDLFRLTTKQGTALTSKAKQHAILEKIYKVVGSDHVTKSELTESSILKRGDLGMNFPTRAWVNYDASNTDTVVEIQAVDRLGLLFEILRAVRRADLVMASARICTEKGAALDTIHVTDAGGKPVTESPAIDDLIAELNQIIGAVDPTLAEEEN